MMRRPTVAATAAAIGAAAVVGGMAQTTLETCAASAAANRGYVADGCARHADDANTVHYGNLEFAQLGGIGKIRWVLTFTSADAVAEAAQLTPHEIAWLGVADDCETALTQLEKLACPLP